MQKQPLLEGDAMSERGHCSHWRGHWRVSGWRKTEGVVKNPRRGGRRRNEAGGVRAVPFPPASSDPIGKYCGLSAKKKPVFASILQERANLGLAIFTSTGSRPLIGGHITRSRIT